MLQAQVNQIIIFITHSKKNNEIEVIRGSLNNVYSRYLKVLKKYPYDNFVRITGDCPLIDTSILDKVIKNHKKNSNDLTSNAITPSFPDGLDVEVLKTTTFIKNFKFITSNTDKEHVTTYLERNKKKFKVQNISNNKDLSNYRLTLDEPEDFELLQLIFKNLFHFSQSFGLKDIMKLFHKKPDLIYINSKFERTEGLINSINKDKLMKKNLNVKLKKGQDLWKKAKKIIPGGNMLLSKRSEMFLPNLWPSYYSKSKGVHVWTIENIKLIDMIFAVGQNTLGYNNSELEKSITKTIKYGNMTSLNCPEEVSLAEKLISMHPWADMVRLARSGGEANSIAIRIARAAAKNTRVAFCGYHGWHDWYLSANIKSDNNLSSHLLPGLRPEGVPKELLNTAFPFEYNKYQELEKLVDKRDIGIIKMEVSRNFGPENNFLEKVRKLCDKKNIILIFDECTSGFRETFGGIHLKYKVNPDIAMFGKALGNGFAINAVIGKKSVMESAQNTFISSTFWTERIGPAAAVKTLELMQKYKSWKVISKTGKQIKKTWELIAKRNKLSITTFGLDAICGFSINSKNSNLYKTFITQEMLKKNILASNLIYVSLVHTKEYLEKYFNELDRIFNTINKFESNELNTTKLIQNIEAHQSFKRLN